jgi:curved DNA-binding protein CbpA
MENFNPKLYEVLGRLPQHATQAEIKEAYRRLVMRYHPDKNPGDEANAQEITQKLNEAYEILSNPQKRSAYDERLKAHVLKEEQEVRLKKERMKTHQKQEKSHWKDQRNFTSSKNTSFGGIPMPKTAEELAAVGGIALGMLALGMLVFALMAISDETESNQQSNSK